jgi:hypothetical protein
MTRTTPSRRMTLHFSHRFFTPACTFISRILKPYCFCLGSRTLLIDTVPIGNAALREIIWRHFQGNLVAGQYLDIMHAHFPGNMGQHNMPVLELYPEHCVREWLHNGALDFDYFLCTICHKLQFIIIVNLTFLVKAFTRRKWVILVIFVGSHNGLGFNLLHTLDRYADNDE